MGVAGGSSSSLHPVNDLSFSSILVVRMTRGAVLTSTLCHEVGHSFGLEHTNNNVARFVPSNGTYIQGSIYELTEEFPFGENCESFDDHVCDTYPQVLYTSDDNCEYVDYEDFGYHRYMPQNPNEDIIMDQLDQYELFPFARVSKSNKPFQFRQHDNFMGGGSRDCKNKFTPGQSLRMASNITKLSLAATRCEPGTNFWDGEIEHTEFVISPSSIGESDGSIILDSESGFVFSHLVDGIEIESGSAFLHLENLPAGQYDFKARLNVCSEYSYTFSIILSDDCAPAQEEHNADITAPSCSSHNGIIDLSITDGYQFFYQVEDGLEGPYNTLLLEDLTSEDYQFIAVHEEQCNGYPFSIHVPLEDCPWDLDGDEIITGEDFGIFLANFGIECCPMDLDKDGYIGQTDLELVFLAFGTTCEGCPEDINGDTFVNFDDLLELAQFLGTACGCCEGDFDLDGFVTGDDFGLFIGHFGLDCED